MEEFIVNIAELEREIEIIAARAEVYKLINELW